MTTATELAIKARELEWDRLRRIVGLLREYIEWDQCHARFLAPLHTTGRRPPPCRTCLWCRARVALMEATP